MEHVDQEIAEKAGVSPATVSRVLNNPNYKCSVSGLRDKIWKTAIEMNYVPNEAARNLKRGVSAKQEKTWYINISDDKKPIPHRQILFFGAAAG